MMMGMDNVGGTIVQQDKRLNMGTIMYVEEVITM
jgi:hypothetical protein